MGKTSRGSHAVPLRGKRHGKLRTVLLVILGLVLAAVIAAAALCFVWLQDLPDYSDAEDFNTAQPTMVYASDHRTLLARFQLENREPLSSLDEISDYVTEGTVATEDERFYEHIGVDPVGIARAVMNNLTGGSLEGASTITQQLVRNTVLADEMDDITLKRKVREAYLAIQMERLFTKDQILLMYLNTINYGSGAYGIQAAAERYYSKPASELTLDEAALLVGIPQSPTYNNPIDNPDHALERRGVVLDRMVSYGIITREEADAAQAKPIELNPSTPTNDGIELYPYFSSYVRDQLTSSFDLSTADVFQGGLTVYTTLDPQLQQLAEEAADEKEAGLPSEMQVAMTVIDPDTGYVKAMVGGKDYYENQWNLATQAQRPAGSSFKTFTLTAAIEEGISPNTYVNCGSQVTINDWEVANINHNDYGVRSIASAFAVSSNTGFARLVTAVGVDKVVDVAHRMGITSELPEVPALTLGAGGVTTLEMADAYATIANGGTHYAPNVIEQVVDGDGNILIDNTQPEGDTALSPEVAHAATEVMEGVVQYGTGYAASLPSGQPVAGKTGTSENYMDIWFCGITPQLSVAIWIGDPQNVEPVPSNVSATDVFRNFVSAALEDEPIEDFPDADDPAYTKHFSNTDLDIKGITWSSTSESSDAEDTQDDVDGEDNGEGGTGIEAPSTEPGAVPGVSGDGSASGGGGASAGGTSGGDSSDGGETPGGGTDGPTTNPGGGAADPGGAGVGGGASDTGVGGGARMGDRMPLSPEA